MNYKKLVATTMISAICITSFSGFADSTAANAYTGESFSQTSSASPDTKQGTLPDESGFLIMNGILFSYSGTDEVVNIPNTVTSIMEGAFQGNTTMVELTIPNTVLTIGDNAFQQCANLARVTFEEGSQLTTIKGNTFNGCSGLKYITLPDSLTTIEDGAFSSTGKQLESITIPKNVTTLGSNPADVFSKNLQNIHVDKENTTYYSDNGVLFQKDTGTLLFCPIGKTGGYEIPEDTKAIAASAFEDSSLDYVSIPDSVTTMGERAFANADLKAVAIPSGIQEIPNRAFYNSKLQVVEIGNGVTTIGTYAFGTNYYLKGLVLPPSVSSIGANAIYDLDSVFKLLKVENASLEIDESNFTSYTLVDYWMSNSKMVAAADSTLKTYYDALVAAEGSRCKTTFLPITDYKEATKVTVNETEKRLFLTETASIEASVEPADATMSDISWYSTNSNVASVNSSGVVTANAVGTATIIAQTVDGAKATCQVTVSKDPGKSDFLIDENGLITGYIGDKEEIIIPEEANDILVKGIADDAFAGSSFTSVTIPASVKSIGNNAFADSEYLTHVTIGDGVESIGQGAFENSALREIVLPASIKEIGSSAFSGCRQLTKADIQATIDTIPESCFSGCRTLNKVTFNTNVETIGSEAFGSCSSLTQLSLPASLKIISDSAFAACSGLTSVELPEGVEKVGDKAFFNCTALKSFYVSSTVTQLGDTYIRDLFEDRETDPGAKLLTEMNVSPDNQTYKSVNGSVYSKDGKTFLFCPRGLTKLNIAEGTTHIEDYACFICFELQKITLPSTLKSVGHDAFHYCEGVTELVLPEGLETVEESAFFGLEAWEKVIIPSTVKTIGAYGFAECGASTLVIPEGIERIEEFAFWGYEGTLQHLVLPGSVNYIGDSAFAWGKQVKHVYIPENVTYVGDESFGRWDSLTWLTFPKKVEEIGDRALTGNKSQEAVFIPSTVQTLGSEITYNCPEGLVIFSDTAGGIVKDYADTNGLRYAQLLTEKEDSLSADILIENAQNLLADNDETPVINVTITDESQDTAITNVLHSGLTSITDGAIFRISTQKETSNNGTTSEFEDPITLSMEIPDQVANSNRTIRLYQIQDGAKTELSYTTEGNRLFASIDPNGTYGLLSASTRSGGNNGSSTNTEDKAVTEVEQLIDAIGAVNKNSGDKITAAREAYDALSTNQKAEVDNYAILTAAEDAYAQLIQEENLPFLDISDHWAKSDILFVYEQNLMNGVGNQMFQPQESVTRAMMATILYRLAGEPAVSGETIFRDVVENSWYAPAVLWASQNDVITGYNENTFGTNDNTSREQLAAMLYRYAGSPSVSGDLSQFTDAAKASEYARDALIWAVDQQILNGKGNRQLDPRGNTTRAEIAAIMHRYIVE